jgi:hypothetical protein
LGNATGGGNVIAYNYVPSSAIAGPYYAYPDAATPGNPQHIDTWMEDAVDTSHGSFSHADLYEGNYAANFSTDATHGNNGWMTFFRNHSRGRNADDYADTPLAAVRIAGWSTEHASIGNVWLSPETISDFPNAGVWSKPGSPQTPLSVYMFGGGWDINGDNGQQWAYERFTWLHDFNYVDGRCISKNAEDEVNILPESLYLTGAPDYFEGYVWPPVNPFGKDDAERIGRLPAKERYK